MEFSSTLSALEPVAMTIGNFDGVHRGHWRLMEELRAEARKLGCKPVVVTFSPHTLMVVRPDIGFSYLTTLEEKLALLKRYGAIADSVVIHFTREVADMSANAFLDSLREHWEVKALVVGENFSLGHNRIGDVTFLREYGQRHDIRVRAIALEASDTTRINSTSIRELVRVGRVKEANEMLGHAEVICDTVRHGDKRGRLLGFPTANLIPEPHKLLPANGIYATRVWLQDIGDGGFDVASPVYKGAASIGVRPTFGGKDRIVEVYLLDVERDLYDQRITIEFIERLRDEERFDDIEELKAQMAVDVEQVRQRLV